MIYLRLFVDLSLTSSVDYWLFQTNPNWRFVLEARFDYYDVHTIRIVKDLVLGYSIREIIWHYNYVRWYFKCLSSLFKSNINEGDENYNSL